MSFTDPELCYTPNQIIGYSGHERLPVLDNACGFCGRLAEINGVGVTCSRINGDSKYGYSTYHDACLDAEYERLDKQDKEDEAVIDSGLADAFAAVFGENM